MSIIERIRQEAVSLDKRIVYPEGEDERLIIASSMVTSEGIARVFLLGDEKVIREKAAERGVSLSAVQIINPLLSENLEQFGVFL